MRIGGNIYFWPVRTKIGEKGYFKPRRNLFMTKYVTFVGLKLLSILHFAA